MRLQANKAFKYGTRHLLVGEQFEAAEPYCQTLLLTKLAKEPGNQKELDELRARAITLGIPLDMRWGPKRIRDRISEHGG